MNDSEALGARITSASITSTVNTKYNVLNATFSDPNSMTFKRYFPADNSQEFAGQKYTLIASQYIMPSDAVTVGLKVYAGDTERVSFDIDNVPTVANKKVNIYGSLATTSQTITINIDTGCGSNDDTINQSI